MKSFPTDPIGTANVVDRLDRQFHETVLEAAGVELVTQFHDVLVDYFRENGSTTPPSMKEVREHEAIAKAFSERNTDMAVQVLTKHLRSLYRND